MPFVRKAVTRLSHLGAAWFSNLGRMPALARESLIVLAGMSASFGCLVADPPEYSPPARTPPILDLFRADPPVREVLVARKNESIAFNVPVRSEDAGDPLMGAWHLDWGFSSHDILFQDRGCS